MKKFLFNALVLIAGKESKIKIAEEKLKLEKQLREITTEYAERRMRDGYYYIKELSDTEKELFYKKTELKNISDSIRIKDLEADTKVGQMNVELGAQKIVNDALTKENSKLYGIIDSLTKQLSSKIEVIR